MVELIVTSMRAFIKEDCPRLLLPVSQSLWWAPADPHLNRKPFILVQSSVESLFLSSGSWCAQDFYLCPPKLEFLFPPVLWKSYSQILLALKVKFLGNSLVPLLDPQAEKPDVGFRIFTTVRELLWYYCSPVFRSSTSRYGIWFYHDCTPSIISLWSLLCL